MTRPCCLTIAGSDSGGNAGIQADLRTFHAHQLHGCSVLTAITAQNPFAVSAIHLVPKEMVSAQLDAVLGTYDIRALKTGMLATAEIIETVAEKLRTVPHLLKVIDPVMVATSGAQLLEPAAVEALKRDLLPLATCITPNLPEAEVLLGCKVTTLEEAVAAAETLHAMFQTSILIKGGHRESRHMIDVFYNQQQGVVFFEDERIVDPCSTHGTGCTLAAAIVAGLTQGHSLTTAIRQAKRYVAHTIRTSYYVGERCGVLGF